MTGTSPTARSRPLSISIQLSLLFLVTFLLILVYTIHRTDKFAEATAKSEQGTKRLQQTLRLQEEIRQEIEEMLQDLLLQLERPDPTYLGRLRQAQQRLGELQTEYLKLDIDRQERMSVERIRNYSAELGLLSLQVFERLREGDREEVAGRIPLVQSMANAVEIEFATLSRLHLQKVEQSQAILQEVVIGGYIAIYAFAAALIFCLGALLLLLRRRVFQPMKSIAALFDEIRNGNFAARAEVGRLDEMGRIARDVNRMTESLEASYSQMEHTIEERTRQLRDMQEQFVQAAKMSSLGELVSGVAHELNNPLTSIMGFSELARMELSSGKCGPEEIMMLEAVNSEAARCRDIVAGLLQFARREGPITEELRINEIVEKVLRIRERELAVRNISVVRKYDHADPVVLADPNKMQQVVLNLINNAGDAILEKGEQGRIEVSTKAVDGRVVLQVQDTGIGISEPDRVFDPFYTTKEIGKGTGLGLSICYGIVQEHSGEIRAENWAEGARFIVSLPAAPPAAEVEEPSSARQEAAILDTRAASRVLVVDDEEPLLKLQTAFLARMGCESIALTTGAAAQHYLETNLVDVIISDVRMPGKVNGMQLYEWVKQRSPDLAGRFIFISGDMAGMLAGSSSTDLPVPRIRKPFTFEEYSRAVRMLMEEPNE